MFAKLERSIGPPTPGKLLTLAMIPCGALFLWVLNVEHASHFAQAQQPVPVFGEKPPPDAGSCTLIFPVGDLTRVLLQSSNRVELDAHEHLIQLQPGASPIVTCKVYRGIHRPTTPITKQWKVVDIKYVEMDVFQKLVDEAIGNAESGSDGDGSPDPFTDPVAAAKKTAKGPPVLPTVPLNPNVPR